MGLFALFINTDILYTGIINMDVFIDFLQCFETFQCLFKSHYTVTPIVNGGYLLIFD